jgi:hypothetical protein
VFEKNNENSLKIRPASGPRKKIWYLLKQVTGTVLRPPRYFIQRVSLPVFLWGLG